MNLQHNLVTPVAIITGVCIGVLVIAIGLSGSPRITASKPVSVAQLQSELRTQNSSEQQPAAKSATPAITARPTPIPNTGPTGAVSLFAIVTLISFFVMERYQYRKIS